MDMLEQVNQQLHQPNNILMHLLSVLRVAVDLLEMLKAMRLDLAFDHKGVDSGDEVKDLEPVVL